MTEARSPFDNMSLLELIVKSGIGDAITCLPEGIKGNKDAVAEIIANNVRSKIVKEQLTDPAFFNKMSVLLDEIIQGLKAKRLNYGEYLKQIAELAKQVQIGQAGTMPEQLNTPGRRALYNNLGEDEELAIKLDDTVKRVRSDAWRGHQARENEIKRALLPLLSNSAAEVERIFLIIIQQQEY